MPRGLSSSECIEPGSGDADDFARDLRCEVRNEERANRPDELRAQGFGRDPSEERELFRGAGPGGRSDGVHTHAVLAKLDCGRTDQTRHRSARRAQGGLTQRTEESDRSCVKYDRASVAGIDHCSRCDPRQRKRPADVHVDHASEQGIIHLQYRAVGDRPGSGEQPIDSSEGRNGTFDEALGTLGAVYVGGVGDCFAATFTYRVSDSLSDGGIVAASVYVGAQIVDQHPCSFGCARQRVSTSHASSTADNDDDLSFENAHQACSVDDWRGESRLEGAVFILHLDCGWPAACGLVYYECTP